jgi:hypothetical protein
MKFLYIAAEHVSGTLALLQAEHRRRGDECRYVTFFRSRWNFPDDICLDLPWMPDRRWIRAVRRGLSPDYSAQDSALPHPPYWNPNRLTRTLFQLRDLYNWPLIRRAILTHDLRNVDVITLDGGLDFTRDCRFARACKSHGAHIGAFYHGTDLRNRGIIRAADELIELRLTSEWDLLELDPRLNYLYLAFDTAGFSPTQLKYHTPIRIVHAARNAFKGTAELEQAVANLRRTHAVELRLFRDRPHDELLRELAECDLVVDQLTNAGGWGYGMTSVEALALGKPVLTNIPSPMQQRIGAHPFIQADTATIEQVLRELLTAEARAQRHAEAGLKWVRERHDIRAVADQLYAYYERAGWLRRPT